MGIFEVALKLKSGAQTHSEQQCPMLGSGVRGYRGMVALTQDGTAAVPFPGAFSMSPSLGSVAAVMAFEVLSSKGCWCHL